MSEAESFDIEEAIHSTLVDQHGEGQTKRVKGYFFSQSLHELMKYLDSGDIMVLQGERDVKDKSESFGRLSLPSVSDYTSMEEQLKRQFVIDYDRRKHGQFNWPEVKKLVTDYGLTDIAVSKVVYRFTDDDLHGHLLSLLQEAVGYSYESNFEQPFYAVLQSRPPGSDLARRKVRQYNDDSVFTDLGWQVRSMDLDAVWSHRAWTNDPNVVAGRHTQRGLEDLAFNHVSDDAPEYGAVNSNLVFTKWRRQFTNGQNPTARKAWEWSEDGDWKRVQ